MEENYSALVEQNGEGGFKSYRVPGLVTVSNGEVLIYYEGRGEEGDCRTLLGRRSLDGGRSFLQRQILVQQQGAELIHNPMMIAGPEGRVWLFWCQDYHRLFVRESWDNGEHFGPTKELTQVIEGFRSIWPVTLWAISPGHGLFLREGRLVIPLWLSRGKNAHLPACFACLFSDDLGQNWKCGSIVQAGEGIDLGQMVFMGQALEDYLALGAQLDHVHLHDSHPAIHMALGDGDLPLADYLTRLEEWGYQGMYALECNDPRYRQNPALADRRNIAWLEANKFLSSRS